MFLPNFPHLFRSDASLPSVALPVGEGRDNLWGKTREAYRYVWDKYRDQADWFMKADDDTSVDYFRQKPHLLTFEQGLRLFCQQIRYSGEPSLHVVGLQQFNGAVVRTQI